MFKSFGKKSLIISLTSLMITVIAAGMAFAAGGDPLVRNGDFTEMEGPNQPAEWGISFQPGSGSLYSGYIDSEFFNGEPALRLGGADESGRAIAVQRDIPAEDLRGKTLKVSAWYHGDAVVKRSGAENFIRVEFFKREGEGLSGAGASRVTHAPEGSTDWVLLTSEFQVPDETDVMWISISLRESAGMASWAGIELKEVN